MQAGGVADGRDEFRHGWGTVLASLVGLACSIASLGFAYSIGVFISPLGEEFGWTRQEILGANGFVGLTVVAMTPLVGWITDRFGVRRLIILSQIGLAAGFFLQGLVTRNLATFYGIYLLMSVMSCGTIAITFSKLLTREFVKNRGIALGMAMSGSGLCGFAVPPYAAWVIENFGWRMGYVSLGLLPLFIALPLALFFLHDHKQLASDKSSHAGSDPQEATPGASAEKPRHWGLEPRQAFLSYRFWAMAVVFTLASSTITVLITNFVPILADQGVAPTRAAAIAGTFGIAVIVGRVIVGALIDRIWAPVVGFILFVPAAAATWMLGTGLDVQWTIVAIFVAGFAAGAEVDLMGYMVARYFGLAHYGKIYAGLYIGFALGPAIATPLFGGARDALGSYEYPLYFASTGVFIAALLLLSLGPYPDRKRVSAAT